MIDPDIDFNDAVATKERPLVHWLVMNIPSGVFDMGEAILPYRSSLPSAGMTHRYQFLLYKQPGVVDVNPVDYTPDCLIPQAEGRLVVFLSELSSEYLPMFINQIIRCHHCISQVFQLLAPNLLTPCSIKSLNHLLLVSYKQERQLHSHSKILFTEPQFAKSWGSHSFLCAAPCLWNKHPEHVKSAKSVNSFEILVKTFMMKSECGFFD